MDATRTVLLLFFILEIACLPAQTAGPHFRQFSLEQGLPSATVLQFLTDVKGYGWVATSNGLSRFDGYRFYPVKEKAGMQDDAIAAIETGNAGELWILTNAGKVYRHSGDSLRESPCSKVVQGYKNRFLSPHAMVWNPADKSLYIALGGLGILRINATGDRHELIRPKHKRDLLAIKVGNRWLSEFRNYPDAELTGVPENEAGVELHHPDGSINRIAGLSRYSPKIDLGGILEIAEKQYLVYHRGYFYLIDNNKITSVIPFGNNIRDLKIGPNNAFWIGLPDKQELRKYASLDDLIRGKFQVILRTSVRSCYFDKNGGLWVASLQDGLFYAVNPSVTTLSDFNTVGNNHVSTLCKGAGNQVFVGFINGKQLILDTQTLESTDLPRQEPAGSMVNANAWSAETGTLWSGKRSLAFYSGGKWTDVLLPAQAGAAPKPCRAANSIRISPDGRRVWACSRQMFVCLEAKTRRFTDISTQHGLKESFEDILEDRRGQVWVGNERGLFLWKNGRLESQSRIHPGASTGVTGLFERSDGTLVIATKSGLILWNALKKQYDLLQEQNGLPEDQVGSMTEDASGTLWLASSVGGASVSLYEDGRWNIRRFSTFDGLPANQVTAVLSVNDQIWFGTSKGIAMITPQQLPGIQTPPPPFFESLTINQNAAPKTVFNSGPALKYSHDENNLQLEFINLNFATGAQTLYRYRIQPGQPWQFTQKPEVRLFSLQPGSYPIEVCAADAQGAWSAPARLPIEILPPFWQTWWFRLLVVLCIGVPLLLFYRYRLRVLRKEMDLREQTNELEKQALRAQMDPHFIFNSLNSVQEFILTNDKMAAANFLSRFATLIRQVLDQSFRKEISLESEIEYLENYLSLEAMRFRGAFQYEIYVDPALDTADIQLPPMLVQPFLENAIIHGMRGKTGDGLIILSFKQSGKNDLVITVEDNGPGLNPAQNEAPKAHISYGSSLAKRRLELLTDLPGASITFENREPPGARVTVTLPGIA